MAKYLNAVGRRWVYNGFQVHISANKNPMDAYTEMQDSHFEYLL